MLIYSPQNKKDSKELEQLPQWRNHCHRSNLTMNWREQEPKQEQEIEINQCQLEESGLYIPKKTEMGNYHTDITS